MPRTAQGPRLKWDAKTRVWKIHYRDGNHSRRLSTRTDSRAAAEEIFRGWLAESEILSRSGPRFTIGECLDIYWTEHVEMNCASSARIRTSWNAVRPFLGKRMPAELDQALVNEYVRYRCAMDNGRGGKVKPHTVRSELLNLMAAIRYVGRTRRLPPEEMPGYFKMPEAAPRRERFLTTQEIGKLKDAARALRKGARLSRLERWLAIALHTGARKTAISRLEWDRVDFERGLIDLEYDPGRRGRNKKRRPTVPIATDLLPVLQQAYRERRTAYVLDQPTKIDRQLAAAVKAAGLEGVSPHVLRHTWASHAAMRGVPLLDIARVLGNSIAMVEQVYAKYAPEYLKSAVDGAYSNGPDRSRIGPNGAECRPQLAGVGRAGLQPNAMISHGFPEESGD